MGHDHKKTTGLSTIVDKNYFITNYP